MVKSHFTEIPTAVHLITLLKILCVPRFSHLSHVSSSTGI